MRSNAQNPAAKLLRAVRKAVSLTLLSIGAAFCVVTFTPSVKLLVQATEPDWYSGDGEVLVVLGGGMLVPGTGANATLTHESYLRCVYASWVLQRQSFRYIVVTGETGVAEAMARFLIQRGTVANKILVENKATSTFENALYTRRLLEHIYGSDQLPEVIVLTSDYHAWRALRVFKHIGLHAKAIPVPDILKRFAFRLERWPDFLLLLNEFTKDAGYALSGKLQN